jgi:hypothetical protein
MSTHPFRSVAAIIAVGFLCATDAHAQTTPSSRDAETMKRKVATMTGFASKPSKQPRRTTVTENEANAYLTYDAHDQLPVGVVDPSVAMLGQGRVSVRAVVDLDAVRKASPSTGMLDPRAFLRGHLPVTATGVLRASGGTGRFELESASVGGVPIPKLILQEIVSFYSKGPDAPSGVSLDDAFALPLGIREVQVERGQAIIVQ